MDQLDDLNIHEDVKPILKYALENPDKVFTGTSVFEDNLLVKLMIDGESVL